MRVLNRSYRLKDYATDVLSFVHSASPSPHPPKDPELASASSARAAGSDVAIPNNPTAQTIVAEWIDHCADDPPRRVIGQVSKELKTLLDEGIDPQRVRRAVAEWNRKGLHPSTLASVVHEISNRSTTTRTQQATDDLFDRAMQRAIDRDNRSTA